MGSATSLSKALGVTPQAICFWRNAERKIPAEKCLQIERATNGLVRCEDLRPDVEWSVLRGPATQQPATKPETQEA